MELSALTSAIDHYDGGVRGLDNVFMGRFWRSYKYECVYVRCFETVSEIRSTITTYVDLHNNTKPHQAPNYQTPFSVFEKGHSGFILTP
jgi:putative transposase